MSNDPGFDTPPPASESADPLKSPLWPQGGYDGEFVPPVIPEDLFMIRYNGDDDNVDGPFDGTTFVTDPITNIAYSRNGDGHPVFVRAVNQTGTHIEAIDGDGTPYTMDIQVLPDNEMTIEDATPEEIQ